VHALRVREEQRLVAELALRGEGQPEGVGVGHGVFNPNKTQIAG
jgi:hypothetical protein